MRISESQIYRLARDSDFEEIFLIWSEGIKTTFPDYNYPADLKEQFRKNFSNRSGVFNFWIVEIDNTLIGWCSILPIFSNPIKRPFNAEVSTYIDRNCSSNGIGQALMKFVFIELKKSNLKAVYGFANTGNENSIQMCVKAGMSICGATNNKTILIIEINENIISN